VVEVAGELDMMTSPQLRDALQRLLDDGTRNVVIDLAEVRFMDSTTLGVLVVTFRALRDRGGRLCLAAAQRSVRAMLAVTNVDQAIVVYDTVEAAEASMPPVVA